MERTWKEPWFDIICNYREIILDLTTKQKLFSKILDQDLLNIHQVLQRGIPAGKYMFTVNYGNTRTRCEIYSKLTIKTPERRQWRRSGVFIVNFEHISHLVLVFLKLTLSS